MTLKAVQRTRAKILRQQLANIDERLVTQPVSHPFADDIEQGEAKLGNLLQVAEKPDAEIADRVLALQAIGVILLREGAIPIATSILSQLGTTIDQHPAIRAAAARSLLMSGQEHFVKAVVSRLASEDTEVVKAAAHALGAARRSEAVEALIELFAKHESVEVQSECAWALGEIGSPRALEILEMAFRKERCLHPVIEALGKLGNEQTMAFVTVALRDSSESIRYTAAEALARLIDRHPDEPHTGVAECLRKTLEMETSSNVCVVLISCLRRLQVAIPKDLVPKALARTVRSGSFKSAAMQQAN